MCQAVVHGLRLQPVQPCATVFLKTCRPWLQSMHHNLLACLSWACCCCDLCAWHCCMQLVLLLLILLIPCFTV